MEIVLVIAILGLVYLTYCSLKRTISFWWGKRINFFASAAIHSGLPDPIWEVDQKTGQKFISAIRLLPTYQGLMPDRRQRLGYRGAYFYNTNGETWYLCDGDVTYNDLTFFDKDRLLEKSLLATAPEGTFPPQFIF